MPSPSVLAMEEIAVKEKEPASTEKEGWAGRQIFPTQVLVRDWKDVEDTNAQLKNGIWRERALDPEGLYRSNQSGTWHSQDKILERLGLSGRELWKMFGEGFTTYAYNCYGANNDTHTVDVNMSAWAMVYSNGGYAAVHTHPNCHISGVYYVDNTCDEAEITMATGVRIKPGDIEFLDTRRGGEFSLKNMRLSTSAIFSYKTGRMLIFPSALPHYVHPVVGDGERIAIACNATYSLKEKS